MSASISSNGPTTFGYTGAVVQASVQTTGIYYVVAYGAQGGNIESNAGGLGAEIGGEVVLTAGETLAIAAGGQGGNSPNPRDGGGGGGGGGSFVVGAFNTPLVIAGGGGGAYYSYGDPGQTGTSGTAGPGSGAGAGGTNGGGGGYGGSGLYDDGGGGGGGFSGSGGSNPNRGGGGGGGGYPGLAGGAAGTNGVNGEIGGFGGGGGSGNAGGGGGGGYSGGGGGAFVPGEISGVNGGGGGSFDSGTNQLLVAGENSGNGSVVIAPVDRPAINGTVAGQATSSTATIHLFAGVVISDPTLGTLPEMVTVTPSTTTNGALSDPNLGSDHSTISNGTYTVTGTAAQVQADLEGLVFTPAALAPSQSATTGFTIDDTNVAGQSASDGTTSVVVTNPAQPSTISGTAAAQATTDEAAITPFALVAIADPNAGSPTETVTVTPSSTANGALSDPNAASDGSTAGGDAITLEGTAFQVTAALDGLVFTPAAHEVAPGQTVTTGFTITDLNSAGQTATDRTTTVVATAVNDAPTISGTQAGQMTTDNVALQPFKGVSVTDPDLGTQVSLAITLRTSGGAATEANGTLSGSGLTRTGVGTYALAASSPATLTSELDALAFTPTQAEVPAAQTVATTFTLAASQTAGGSTATSTDSTTSVVATALNYVNGPAGGHAVLTGTSGADVITAHGQYNAIFGKGGADIINAGDGAAAVMLGTGNASVTLGGSANLVIGGAGNVTVTGAPGGYTSVTLGSGNDIVQVGGSHDVILLGNGNNLVSGTARMAFIATGSGNDTITLEGSGSTVNAGGGTNTITGGSGGDSFVLPRASQGFDRITGFSETNGDVLDLREAMAGTQWNHRPATLGDYLKVTDSGGSATLSIAPTGSGAGTAIALLNGSGNVGLADLLSHHSLLT
ncbi:beta strand repeat-containing protein [Lichenicoccus sp.]|uniref:beta strand repeat-containing protein n=1 Tax=Lichenicoccus sp. TaxID=2781899 RepID=UPI003D13A5AB